MWYGSLDATMTGDKMLSLEVFESRCLWAITGVTRSDILQHIMIRQGTLEYITYVIRNISFRWFGHVCRM